jgi:hypothetical protein
VTGLAAPTRGPWRAACGAIVAVRPDGTARLVATVVHGASAEDQAQAEPNARLLAAAPELADALIGMLRHFVGLRAPDLSPAPVRIALDLLDRIAGRAT